MNMNEAKKNSFSSEFIQIILEWLSFVKRRLRDWGMVNKMRYVTDHKLFD